MRSVLILTGAALSLPLVVTAQTDETRAEDPIAQATDFSVPSVPAFTLLDVNPATVTRPGLVEDFSFDLLLRDAGLAPDLALEARPVWIFGFSDISRAEYAGMPGPMRAFATASVSLATTVRDDGQNLAWAVKLSPIRPDPLLDSTYLAQVAAALALDTAQQRLRWAREDSLIGSNKTPADTARIYRWYNEQVELLVAESDQQRIKHVERSVEDYRRRTWNAPAVDIAFGQVLDYVGTTFDDLAFSEQGFGAWAIAASGFGTERWLFSALGRWIDLGDDPNWSAGANARFGGTFANGFVEFVWENPDGAEENMTISYGGEFRFDENRVIEFGIRTHMDDDFDLERFRPVVKLRWEIAGRSLEHVFMNRTSR